jgi:hypothetical protein
MVEINTRIRGTIAPENVARREAHRVMQRTTAVTEAEEMGGGRPGARVPMGHRR